MKKSYVLVLLATSVAYAQPIVNPNHLVFNLTSEGYFAEVENLDPGPSGPNRNWEFTNLELMPVGTSTTITPVGTAFENSFPTANYCSATTGQSVGGYSYFRYDNQKMELLGDAFTGIGVFTYLPNPRTYIEFPYTYNKVINDTYHSSNIPFTATYDGYGSLTVAFGTYHNVIRQKIEEDGTTEYIWFNADPFFPIAQTVEGGIGLMRNDAVLSAEQFTPSATPNVWPNPSDGIFNIEIKNMQNAEIYIYGIHGNLIASKKATDTLTKIDLQAASSGMYLMKITTERETFTQKILKK